MYVDSENSQGRISRINLSQPQRDPQFSVSLQQANQWYKAMNVFLNIAHNPDNMIEIKMKEGIHTIIYCDCFKISYATQGTLSLCGMRVSQK